MSAIDLPPGHPLTGKVDLIIPDGTALSPESTGIPNRERRLARCAGGCWRTGLVWRAAHSMTIALMRCPVCGGPVRQTTRGLVARFYRLTDTYVADTAKTGRAAIREQTAKALAAGRVKRTRDLEPGDAILTRGYGPGRVVAVLGPGRGNRPAKSRTAVVAAVTVDVAIARQRTTYTIDAPTRGTVELAHRPGLRWADEHAGEVLLALAHRDVDRLTRAQERAARMVANAVDREKARRWYRVDEIAAELDEARTVADRLEAAYTADLERTPS